MTERKAEIMTIIPKATIGILKGFTFKITLFEASDLSPQSRRRIAVELIINICLGIMKKSVVEVRKITGSKNSVKDIMTVDMVSMYEADC